MLLTDCSQLLANINADLRREGGRLAGQRAAQSRTGERMGRLELKRQRLRLRVVEEHGWPAWAEMQSGFAHEADTPRPRGPGE